jgi:lipopolysaccharide O-acetyltransferase
MAIIKSMLRLWSENGAYGVIMRLAEAPFSGIRNFMLASKLGVQHIQIGSGGFLRGLCTIKIGENFTAGQGLWLEAVLRYNGQTFTPRIIIGRNVTVSSWSHIGATRYIEIGDEVLIGSKVVIIDHNHGEYNGPYSSPEIPPNFRPLACDKQVVIGRNVWLGDGVVVTPGSNIGEGAVIGANSVVVGTIPAFTIAAGAPAKPLKQYDFQMKKWV